MGRKDWSLIGKINPTFVTLTVTAMHLCRSAWNTGKVRIPPECSPGGGAQHRCNSSNIDHTVNDPGTDVVRHLNSDFSSSSPLIKDKMIDNIHRIIPRGIHHTSLDPVMAQPHNDHSSIDDDFLDYIPEMLIAQPNDSCMSCRTRTRGIIKCTKRVLSLFWDTMELGNMGVCRQMMCDLVQGHVNHSSSAHCHIHKHGYTGCDTWTQHYNNSTNTQGC